MRKLCYIPLCLAVLSLCGCKKNVQSSDEREERDPLVKTGHAYMEQRQWDQAEQSFKEALENDPNMAKPHLELAMIYQQHKPDYIHAIYHYDCYLELRPDSEKSEFIREQREKVKRALEIEAIKGSPEFQKLVADMQHLAKENTALKKQLASAAQLSKPAPAVVQQPVAQPAPKTSPQTIAPAATKPSHQVYTAVTGDTLSKIANKFYGDSGKWNVIFDANRDSLASPNSLRNGQTLVIPALEN